jgi:HAD superfamily hydrolase (TIGR01450 family)
VTVPATLPGCPAPLVKAYDGLLIDLDGVVYVGGLAVPHAAEALTDARAQGAAVRFVTNNASRTPEQVSAQLRRHGVAAGPDDVVTSAQAAADLLVDLLPPASRVLVVGGEGVRAALRAVGLEPVDHLDDQPVAVVQGFAPQVDWGMLAEGAFAVQQGLPWVATNTDRTIPTPRGLAPGNGALVSVITQTTGRHPQTVGKPAPGLFVTAAQRMGATRPLVVGDRLDTDIAGARAAGFDSLLVLTGVTGVAELLAAPARWLGYLSTTGVYGDAGGGWVDEDTPPNPGLARARRRRAAEQGWAALGRPLAIFRLAGIYGPGRSPFAELRAGRARSIVRPGQVFGRIHRDDIAQAVLAALGQNATGVFNLADDEPATPAAVLGEAARLLGLPAPPSIPFAEAAPAMSPMALSFWAENRKVSSAKTKSRLGLAWRYPSYREGLAATLAEELGQSGFE